MQTVFSRTLRVMADLGNPVKLIGLFFVVALVFSGGASRADSWGQVVVRLASIVAIAALLIHRPTLKNPDCLQSAKIFAFLVGALIVLQLVPLPPVVWSALPGRAHDVALSTLIGSAGEWRPLNLTPDLGWNSALALLPVFATIAVLARLDERDQSLPIMVVAAVALFSAVLGLAQLTDGPGSDLRLYAIASEASAVGVFANRNHNATLLAVSLPMIAFWGTRAGVRRQNEGPFVLFAFAGTLVVLIMIPATGSRFGLFAGLAGLISSFIWWAKPLARLTAAAKFKAKVLVAGGAIAISASAVAIAVRSERAESIRRLFTASVIDDKRLTIGPTLIKMVREFFPVGSGFGSFEPVFRRFEPIDSLSDVYLNQAHNDLIQIIIEGGLPAAAIFGIFLIWWTRRVLAIWRRGSDSETLQLGRLGTIATAIMLAASLVDYPLRTPLLAAVFTVAAWCMSLNKPENGPAKVVNRPPDRATKASG
jgi:O-antigen ligase